MKNTKVYLMSTENVKDPRTFASWKEFLPKERWEKTVRPLKEEDRKIEAATKYGQYNSYFHNNGIVYYTNPYYASILTELGNSNYK